MNLDVLEAAKVAYNYAVAPMAYIIWDLWRRLSKLEKDQVVTQVMVDNIRDDIKEIKHGVDQLISRQLK